MKQCSICGREADTRPLGRSGADVCFPCMDDPAVRVVVTDNLAAVVYATSIISPTGIVTIDGEEIRPTTPSDLRTESGSTS